MCAGTGEATLEIYKDSRINWEEELRKTGKLPLDLTDERLREAQRAMARRLTQGQGRRATFLTEPLGAPPVRSTLLGGG